MATLRARPTSRLWSRIAQALYRSGIDRKVSVSGIALAPLLRGGARAVAHDNRLGLGELVQRLAAVLLAEPACAGAAEWQLVVEALRRVDPGVAALERPGSLARGVEVPGPDRRPEAERRGIGALDRLVQAAHAPHRQHGAEHLLGRQRRGVIGVDHDGGLEVPASVELLARGPLPAARDAATRVEAGSERRLDPVADPLRVQRSEDGPVHGRRADREPLRPVDQAIDEGIGDRPAPGDALDAEARLAD